VRFASRFFRIFRLVLEAAGDERRWPDWPSVSRELAGLLEEERALPLPPGFGPAERREALWPVLAWIDETFLTSGRKDAAEWYGYSLQRALLDTNRGGELFYRRLKALLDLRGGRPAGGSDEPLSASALSRELGRRGISAGAPGPSGPGGSGMRAPEGFGADLPESAADYLPEDPYMTEYQWEREDPVTAQDLEALWESPGSGPEPLESVLDTYAMCIILGFKGQFSPPADRSPAAREPLPGGEKGEAGEGAPAAPLEELLGGPASPGGQEGRNAAPGTGAPPEPSDDRELLKAIARRQMRSWSSKGAPKPLDAGKRGLWAWLADFWRDYDWIFLHVIIPLLALAAFYFHGAAIVEALPF
jgi:hypothetical protein